MARRRQLHLRLRRHGRQLRRHLLVLRGLLLADLDLLGADGALVRASKQDARIDLALPLTVDHLRWCWCC